MPRLGIITVGQSPRSDIIPYMASMLGSGITVMEKGALDGFSPEQLKAMAPCSGEHCLATRLADGGQIVISHDKVVPLVQERIDQLNREGADIILLLCTGKFPVFQSKALLIESQRIVDHALEAVLGPDRTLGVFVPLAEQKEHMAQSMGHIASKVVAVSASPYLDQRQLMEAAGKWRDTNPTSRCCTAWAIMKPTERSWPASCKLHPWWPIPWWPEPWPNCSRARPWRPKCNLRSALPGGAGIISSAGSSRCAQFHPKTEKDGAL